MFLTPPIGFMSSGAGGGGTPAWSDLTTLQSTELTDGGTFLYQIKEKLKSVGFVVVESYDGTNYSPGNGDIITNSTLMEQSFAWYWIRDPTSTRGWIFQHSSSAGSYGVRNKYSKTNAWAGGSFSTMPTAADEEYVMGSGASFFTLGSLGEYMMGAVEGSDPYSFWFCHISTTPVIGGGCFHLSCEPFDPSDVDPYIFFGASTGSSLWSNSLGRKGWQPDGARTWSNYEVNIIDPLGVPIDGKTGAQVMFWIQDGSSGTSKGWCRRGIFHRDSDVSTGLSNMVSYSKDGVPFSYLKLGGWVMPWDGVRPAYPVTAWADDGELYFIQDDLEC